VKHGWASANRRGDQNLPLIESLHNARRFLAVRGVLSDNVRLGRSVLPAQHLRFGGPEFKDDTFFLASGRKEAQRLIDRCGLTSETRILDIGCGVGRLAIGILSLMEKPPRYWGLDVDTHSVRWCKRHIEAKQSRFQFDRVNALNRRYNPSGVDLEASFRLPYENASFELVYLYSVFSHMMPKDVELYLAQFHRLLTTTGEIFLTNFVETNVPDVVENPEGYHREWTGALHCVRYEQRYFESLIRGAGFEIRGFDYGQETDGQSAFYLSRANHGDVEGQNG
jgi:SAM-dependent methyltransferase